MTSLKVLVKHDKVFEINEIWYDSRFYVRRVHGGYEIHFGRKLYFFPSSKHLERIGGEVILRELVYPWQIWFDTLFNVVRSVKGYVLMMGTELYFIPSDSRLEREKGFVFMKHKTIVKFERTQHRFKKKNIRSLK